MDEKKLKEINVDSIDPNPDNPRVFFRQEELDSLLISISKIGVQVPISVFKDGSRYVLIDGERRLKTCKKLNFKTIPAIVQEKPDKLGNLLLMFNIHALREQWDYFTIARKLPYIIELFQKKHKHPPNEVELSESTGLSRGTIRRCKLIIELPEKFKEIIVEELKKPKSRQVFTADFFLEMEQALKTVQRNYSEYNNNIDNIRNVLIKKYKNKVFNNIIDLRLVQKIATAPKNVEYPIEKTKQALSRIFNDNNEDIEAVYNDTIGFLYDERRVNSTISNLIEQLNSLKQDEINDDEIVTKLKELKEIIEDFLMELENE